MRDYVELVKALRHCIITIPCDGCPYYTNGNKPSKECSTMNFAAADAIEELQDQIAEVGKMVNELIVYAQKEADEWRASQNASYGYDRTVSVYTWANNAKCTHERYVAKLDDIAAKLPEPPKGVE